MAAFSASDMTAQEFQTIRNRLGWSVADTANRLGLSVGTVYKYEESGRAIHPCAARLMQIWVSNLGPAT